MSTTPRKQPAALQLARIRKQREREAARPEITVQPLLGYSGRVPPRPTLHEVETQRCYR